MHCYVLDAASDEELARALSALLEEFEGELGAASVDGYPAPVWGPRFDSLPDEVKDAHLRLSEIAGSERRRFRGDPLMAVRLDLTDPEHRRIFLTYAPHSIHAYAVRSGERLDDRAPFLLLHDSGESCTLELSASDLGRVRAALGRAGVRDEALYPLPRRPSRRGATR